MAAAGAGGLAERRGRVISGIVVLSLRTTEQRDEDREETDSPLELYSYAELESDAAGQSVENKGNSLT